MLYYIVQRISHCLQDLGSPSLSAESQLIVNVGDVNDNPPVFMQALYIAQVLENATTVSQLQSHR